MKINNSINTTNFGHKIIMDIGASNPRGTCKLLVQSDNGRNLYSKKGYLNDTPNGFIDGKDFVAKIENLVKNTNKKLMLLASAGVVSFCNTKDMLLSGLAIFVPGTTSTKAKDDEIVFIPNLKDKEGKYLKNISFKDLEKRYKHLPSEKLGINVNQKDFELIVTKDLGGAGLGIAKILVQKGYITLPDKNNPDYRCPYILGVMTGGGFGSVDIKVKDNVVEFETSESSSYLTGNITIYEKMLDILRGLLDKKDEATTDAKEVLNYNQEELEQFIPILGKLGRQGVSVKSNITVFLRALDREDLKDLLLEAGDARVVTENRIHINNNNKALIDKFTAKEGFVKVTSENEAETVFQIDEKQISPDKLKEARTVAINDYARAISLIAVNKINDGLNMIVLVGPFAQGINEHIKKHHKDYNAEDLPELITKKLKTIIDENHVDLLSTREKFDFNDFKIICEPEINFSDNTFAGDVLLNKKLKFVPGRGDWFSIPIEVLQSKEFALDKTETTVKKDF